MIAALLFACFVQATDTTTLCTASCTMHLDDSSRLRVAERRLIARRSDEVAVMKEPCTKVITDTVTNETFTIDQAISWYDHPRARKISESHIGANKVTFLRAEKGQVKLRIEPDHCTCKWLSTFSKDKLPFVERSLRHIYFTEGK